MNNSSESLPYDAWLLRNPSHPVEFVSDWMEDSEGNRMPVAEATCKLGVSVPALYRVLNGRASISVSLALKLEAVGWGNADGWLR